MSRLRQTEPEEQRRRRAAWTARGLAAAQEARRRRITNATKVCGESADVSRQRLRASPIIARSASLIRCPVRGAESVPATALISRIDAA